MARPVKWTRDLHPIRARAARARTETWGRTDIEGLFGIGRASAQTLMKAIGEVQSVGGAHFVDRTSVLKFLDEMIAADSVDESLRLKVAAAEAVPRPKTLRVSLPSGLRNTKLHDLSVNVKVSRGRIEITANTAAEMLESLATLATAMQNDLERWCEVIEPAVRPPLVEDADLQAFFSDLRRQA